VFVAPFAVLQGPVDTAEAGEDDGDRHTIGVTQKHANDAASFYLFFGSV